MRRLLVIAAVLSAAAPTASALAAPPPASVATLSGVRMPGTPEILLSSCQPGGPSSFTYTATGTTFADPPYIGTFTETGTVTTAINDFALSPASSWTTRFQIWPSAETPEPRFKWVTGTRTYDPVQGSEVRCDLASGIVTSEFLGLVGGRYTASIKPSNGPACHDEGFSQMQLVTMELIEEPFTFADFASDFVSTLGLTTPCR